MTSSTHYHAVGPVLIAGELTSHIVAAIKKLNPSAEIQEKGAYVRVLAPLQCVLTCQSVQEQTGHTFILPDDLEVIMPSFKGIMTMTPQKVSWSFAHPPSASS